MLSALLYYTHGCRRARRTQREDHASPNIFLCVIWGRLLGSVEETRVLHFIPLEMPSGAYSVSLVDCTKPCFQSVASLSLNHDFITFSVQIFLFVQEWLSLPVVYIDLIYLTSVKNVHFSARVPSALIL